MACYHRGMGNRVPFTIASVVSLTAAGLPALLLSMAACDDGPMHNPAYPIEGGPTPRPTKDATVPDPPRTEEDASVDAGSCAPLGTQVDVQNVELDPNNDPIGGAIADGTYNLTSAVFATGTDDAGVAFKRAAVMKISGKDIVWHFDTDDLGKPEPTCCAGTWSFDGTGTMALNVNCNGQQEFLAEIYDFHPTGIPDSGSDAGAPQIMIHVGNLHDIYTKQ